MNTGNEAKGSCLCGKVTLEATIPGNAGVCHCSMCRNWNGGPLITLNCEGQPRIFGQEHVTTFASSDWAERAFCSICGTHLYYRLKQNDQYILSAGLFPDAELTLDHQIFIDEKPAFYNFAEKTQNLTGAEVFAMFTNG